MNTLLRHGQLPREEDGAIEFWRLKDYLGTILRTLSIGLMNCEEQNAKRRRQQEILQYCTDSLGQEILYLSALQGHSGRNPIDLSLQDNVLIPDNLFEYIYHIGRAISLHSITNSGLIAGRQNSSRERQTVFFTAVNPMDKEHKDPYKLDLTKHCLERYNQKTWKKTPRHGVLGRYTAFSTSNIEVLSNKM